MKKVELKAEYVQPQTEVIEVELVHMIAESDPCPEDFCGEHQCDIDDSGSLDD